MSTKILQDAADISKNFREEANRTAQAEIARAKAELRDELLNQSLALVEKDHVGENGRARPEASPSGIR